MRIGDAPLREPIGDAREFADALQRLGFATTEAENLTQDRMRSVIEAFEQKVTSDAVALVFFTGYGIQSGGHTYLIPVDAAIWNEQDIKIVGFNLDRILSDLAERGARLRLVIVDGARRNPYERRFRPTGSLGMAAVNGTPGVLALYSSLPGTTFDESGGNTSPFVDALITAISKPGAQAEEAFRRARADAARVYRGSQTPWVSSFLDEDVPLDGGDCRAPHAATAEAVPPAPSSSSAPAPAPAQPPTAPVPAAPPAQTAPPARPAAAIKAPARPVSPVVSTPAVTASDAPPPDRTPLPPPQPAPRQQPPAETTGVPAHVAEQTAAAVAPPTPSPPPAPPPTSPAAPDLAEAQPTAPMASPATTTPAAEPPPPPPSPRTPPPLPEQTAVETPPRPVPTAAPPPPAPAPPPTPRQEVAISVPPPPAVADDPIANEPITDPARLKEIKDRLYDRGLDPGEPGSAEMRNAILTYEKEAALPPTEQPTMRLLSSLRAAPVPTPWAAITVAKDFKRWGMSWHEDTRRAALAGARARCGSDECVAGREFLRPPLWRFRLVTQRVVDHVERR